MAFKSRNPSQSGHHVDDTFSGAISEAPPSTIAAALISHISTTKASPSAILQDDLQRIMSDVSSRENRFDSLAEEEKLEHKHQLIYVFVRAVLERLNRDDPFADMQTLLDQAREALDLLTATISMYPTVLLCRNDGKVVLQNRGSEPLWLWLFPRLLSLLGRRNSSPLDQAIKEFFHTALEAVMALPKLWNLGTTVLRYLKQCISSR